MPVLVKQQYCYLRNTIAKVYYYQISKQMKGPCDDTLSIKLVLVGDGNVGKTSLLISYTTDAFPSDYVPTIFDNYLATLKHRNQFIKLWLWDTAGQDQYKRLRALSYPNTDAFLICFSLIDPRSFNHALNKWLPEVRQANPHALVFFVGTKSDLFEQQQSINLRNRPIILPYPIMIKKIEASGNKLLTCSAISQDGLDNVFSEVIRNVLDRRDRIKIKKKEQESSCVLI